MLKGFTKTKNDFIDLIIKNRNLIFNLFVVIIFLFLSLSFYSHFINDYFFSDDFEWLSFGERIKEDPVNIYKLHVSSFYSPVVNLFFYAGQTFFPFNHINYHLLIIFFHFINTVLVYFLSRKIFKNKLASFFGAMFFCLNAYHYEALVWISAVMHVLVTFSTLVACLFYVKFIKTKKYIFLATTFLLAIAAFLTKESGVAVFAFIFAIYFFYHSKDFFKFKNYYHLIPFFLTLGGILSWSYLWQRNTIWITEGIYKIEINAYQKLINSITEFFSFIFLNYQMGGPEHNFLFFAILFLLFLLFIIFRKKILPGYLMSLLMMISGFLPAIFFYNGTWNDIAASRYAYLPAVGGAMFVSSLYLLFAKNKYLNLIVACLFLVVSWNYFDFNYQNVLIKHREYYIVDKQSRGMVNSFVKYKDLIAKKEGVVLLQSFPFYGNNYFIYMYKLVIDENYRGAWIKELDWDKTMEKYNNDKYAIFIWDNDKYEFILVNSDHETLINPALKAVADYKKVIKFIEENAAGITEEEIEKIPMNINLIYGKDTDGDGLKNSLEDAIGTEKNRVDSDNDGYFDKTEILNDYSPISKSKTKKIYNNNIIDKYLGKVVIQVEKNGEAWYVNPEDRKRYFLGPLENAFVQLHYLGLIE